MEVYTIGDDDLTPVPDQQIELEQDLQSHLLKASGAKIGGIELMYISQEGTSDDDSGYFDILGVDENGDTVIVELKRGKTPRVVVSQTLEYASGVRKEPFEKLNDRFQSFRRSRGETIDEDLREAHADFFRLEGDPLDTDEFNTDFHLVIVAAEYDDVTLNMADLLRDHGIDVICVRYQTFSNSEEDIQLLTTEGIRRPLSEEPPASGGTGLTPTQELQQEFWQLLIDKLGGGNYPGLSTESAPARNYLRVHGSLPVEADITLGTDANRGQIQVKLHLRDEDSAMYDQLVENKSEIESKIGEDLIWDPDSARYEQIRLVRDGDITDDRENWDEYHSWLIESWERFDELFESYLQHSSE